MSSPAVHHAQQALIHLKALKNATAHPVPPAHRHTVGENSHADPVELLAADYYEILDCLTKSMSEVAPALRQLLFSYDAAAERGAVTVKTFIAAEVISHVPRHLSDAHDSAEQLYDKLSRAAADLWYVTDAPERSEETHPITEREMALAYVRANFAQTLPKRYADWYLELARMADEGRSRHEVIDVPDYIQETGMIPRGAYRDSHDNLKISIYAALASLRQTSLLRDES